MSMRDWLELAHYHCPIHSYPVAQRAIQLCMRAVAGIHVEHMHKAILIDSWIPTGVYWS